MFETLAIYQVWAFPNSQMCTFYISFISCTRSTVREKTFVRYQLVFTWCTCKRTRLHQTWTQQWRWLSTVFFKKHSSLFICLTCFISLHIWAFNTVVDTNRNKIDNLNTTTSNPVQLTRWQEWYKSKTADTALIPYLFLSSVVSHSNIVEPKSNEL